MQLTSVEIHSPTGLVTVLSYRDPKALNPYMIKTITGLDAEMSPNFFGANDISRFYNLILKKRTVVMQAGLNPDFSTDDSYSDLRDDLYRFIAASRKPKVELQFKKDDVVVAVVSGFITKLETDQFERDQEAKVTVQCDEPFLKSPTLVNMTAPSLAPSNTILQDDVSTAPHGFRFVLDFTGIVTTLTIQNPDAGYSFTIRPKESFVAGDELHFSSEFDNRYLYRQRVGQLHLADRIDLRDVWPIIFPGTNTFQLNTNRCAWQSIQHYETYWGV